jgi:CheY-like chemotaxis protein
MMPVKDGFEATQDIRDYEKQQGMTPTPIIALTASVVDDDIQKCFDAGMDAYVPKPVRREKLLHEMSNYLS